MGSGSSNHPLATVRQSLASFVSMHCNDAHPMFATYSNETQKIKAINENLGKYYNQNSNNLEKAFLEKFGNLGISLYKTEDVNLNNWAKLELDSNLAVIQIPCNN